MRWQHQVETLLNSTARSGLTISYRALADGANVPPPHRIRAVTDLLEDLIRADHAAGRPLLAAVAVSSRRAGLPGPGFFRLCREIGRYFGPEQGPQAAFFHALELSRLHQAAQDRDRQGGGADGQSGGARPAFSKRGTQRGTDSR